jgi:hypothetical protein
VDGDVDLHDFAEFQVCFNPFAAPDGSCAWFDREGDEDIDLDDFEAFVQNSN